MKTITQGFQDTLKGIKQINAIISYADRENTNYIITQSEEFLLTEAQDFLVTESASVIIDNGGIQKCSIYWNTDLLKSVCKMLDLETNNNIPKGTELNIKVGLLVDGEYEYVDYGKFTTTQDSEYNFDTGSYLTTAYDNMVRFNINASENPLAFEEGRAYNFKQYLEMICDKCGVPYSLGSLIDNTINAEKTVIDTDFYANDKNVTYRDIIDDIAECLGTNFIINEDNKFTYKTMEMTSVMTIDAENLKDSNVYVGEKKSPIDGLQIYDGSTLLNFVGEDTSIFKIKNNNIMSAKNSELINGVFSMIRDAIYYHFNLDTFGVLALEPFDVFTTAYNNTNYMLCSFHNEINISGGLEETISYEFKEEDSIDDYRTSSSEDKLRDAYIEIDKANGQIVLKATSDGKIVEAELTASPSEGSEFNIKADNINLEGYTSINDGFQIDSNGNAIVSGGKITLEGGSYNNPNFECKTSSKRTVITPNSIYIDNYRDQGIIIDRGNLFRIETDTTGAVMTLNRTVLSDDYLVTPAVIINGKPNETGVTIYGDLFVTGTKNRLVQTDKNKGVLLNAFETATPYFGDIGSSKTDENGYCKIEIDDVFAQTIEKENYKVFIQECGDGKLYVEKHEDYFEVKGTPNLDFDWELKAIQKGFADVRLKEMNDFEKETPIQGDDE